MNAAVETTAPAREARPTRPFYWLVRRELWENRSLYLAPLAAAGVVFIGFLLNALHLPQGMQILANLDPERQGRIVTAIYGGVGVLIVITMAIVAWFYALDALFSERRDRSILFWKSLPASDTQTVLSKLFVAMAVAPAIAFVVIVALQLLLLILSSIVVVVGGASPTPLWSNLHLLQLTVVLLYSLAAMSLWYAPIYAWLLLVSAWAKKSTFLWAVAPFAALALFESLAFDSQHIGRMLAYRFRDGLSTAFDARAIEARRMADDSFSANVQVDLPEHLVGMLDPVRFLSNPWLWVGLIAAAAFTAAAVWMRRYREPI